MSASSRHSHWAHVFTFHFQLQLFARSSQTWSVGQLKTLTQKAPIFLVDNFFRRKFFSSKTPCRKFSWSKIFLVEKFFRRKTFSSKIFFVEKYDSSKEISTKVNFRRKKFSTKKIGAAVLNHFPLIRKYFPRYHNGRISKRNRPSIKWTVTKESQKTYRKIFFNSNVEDLGSNRVTCNLYPLYLRPLQKKCH